MSYGLVYAWNQVSDVYPWQPLSVPIPPGTTSCAGSVQTLATPQ
jgi:hypothetical protein